MVVRELVALLGFKTDDASLQKAESSIDGLKSAAIKLSAIFLSGAVVAGFNKLIDLASESAESLNKFQAVFENATDSVQKQLDDTSKRTGIASLQLRQFAANIGAIVKPALGSADAAGKVGARMAELALDIASFNDETPEAALVALRSGLIGSAEPLQRFGVDVRVAALEQEALRLGIRGSIKELTEGQRIQIRTSAIIRQLGSQGALGDATRTAKDFANASRALASQLKQLGATIGGFLLKDAGRTVAIYTKIVTAINDWIKVNKELIQQRVDQVLQVINNTIEGVVRTLGFIIGGWQQLSEVLGPVASNLLLVTGILFALIAILGAPVVLFLAISAAIGLVIDDLVVFAQGGESAFGLLIDKAKKFAEDAGIDLDGFFDFFIGAWDFVVDAAGDMFDEIAAFFGVGEGDVEEFIESIKTFFEDGFDDIAGFIKKAIEAMREFFGDLTKEGDGLFEGLGKKLLKFVKSIASGPLGQIILTTVGGAAGAIIGGRIGDLIGPKAAAFLTIAGGAAGGLLGGKLAASIGGGGELPAAPAVGGGGVTLTQGGNNIELNISGGSGTPEQVGNVAAAKVEEVLERQNRRTMQQLTTEGSTP